MNRSEQRAFTLIELLVVIAIIAILAAILFPVFAQAREEARKTACLSNIDQIDLAFQMYQQDYDEVMPIPLTGSSGIWWPKLMEPYIKSWGVFRCPDQGDGFGIWGGGKYAWWGNWQIFAGVGYNYDVLSTWLGDCSNSRGRSEAAVSRPADTLAFTDSALGLGIPGTGSSPNDLQVGYADVNGPGEYAIYLPSPNVCEWYNGQLGGWDWAVTPKAPQPDFMGFTSPRHFNGMNCGFVDGHVKYERWQALVAGTNVAPGVADSAVKVLDRSKYIWNPDWTGNPNG